MYIVGISAALTKCGIGDGLKVSVLMTMSAKSDRTSNVLKCRNFISLTSCFSRLARF